jgi:hypothetical protein
MRLFCISSDLYAASTERLIGEWRITAPSFICNAIGGGGGGRHDPLLQKRGPFERRRFVILNREIKKRATANNRR